jgi:hypothetical protein
MAVGLYEVRVAWLQLKPAGLPGQVLKSDQAAIKGLV